MQLHVFFSFTALECTLGTLQLTQRHSLFNLL
jgi:hypothetical protein